VIIATAGHVDHGKTLLVHSLTGIETDRLEEEKDRGLTIDLGFAYIDDELGGRLGFIDVPGHIKFINNMLAGVGAIDYALLVIAADDGEDQIVTGPPACHCRGRRQTEYWHCLPESPVPDRSLNW